MDRKLRFIDFFAGAGGMRKGLEEAGMECVGFCENDRYAIGSYVSMHCITDEQRAYLRGLSLRERQKEILKDEYRNGEWFADDIRGVDAGSLPKSDIWCFGSPCQSFSVAGNREGLDGKSGLVREIFRLLGGVCEADKPEWLIYENVKGMFSSSKGLDFLAILCEMDAQGYDAEWDIYDTAEFGPPQHRERVYTIGHLRSRGAAEVLSIERADGENRVDIMQVGMDGRSKRSNPNQYRVYDPTGIAPTLNMAEGGGRNPYIIMPSEADRGGQIEVIGKLDPTQHSRTDIHSESGIMTTLLQRDHKGPKLIGQFMREALETANRAEEG